MTKSELIKANALVEEIEELESFISKAEKVWTGKIIKQDTRYIFKSSSYGAIEKSYFELDTELKNKVLDVLRNRLEDLIDELERT